MKKLLLVSLLLSVWGTLAAPAEDYSRFTQVNSLACDFRMERHLEIAEKPLVSTGSFYFRRPGFLRWDYKTPLPHGLFIDGDKATAWRDEGGKRAVSDISRQRMARQMADQLRMFLAMDMEQIGKKYKVIPYPQGVDLLPLQSAQEPQQIVKIRLVFDHKLPVVTQTVITEKSGEETVITYTGFQLNKPFPEGTDHP
jgi:outer membrane lipoprotein-sorting protein